MKDSIPVPDPTLLTTEALDRGIKGLREFLEEKIEATNRLKEEKFRKVDQRFELIESARLEQKADTAKAVEAALTAQKEAASDRDKANQEAISKSETSFTKQIDSVDKRVDDLKTRMDLLDGRSTGMNVSGSMLMGGIALAVGLITIIAFFTTNSKVERTAGRIEQSIPVPVTAPAPLPVKQTP